MGSSAIAATIPGTAGASKELDNLNATAINQALLLATSDAFALGSATKMWSDLFLALGAVINFNNGNFTITHSTGNITFDGGSITLAENVTILLDSALSADGKWSGIGEAGGILGETCVFGSLVYFKTSDSRWWKTSASAVATSGGVLVGMCLVAGNAADPTTILFYGKIRADSLFPTLTIGAPVYISATAGEITNTQPSTTDYVIRVIGQGKTADELFFNPSQDYITHT